MEIFPYIILYEQHKNINKKITVDFPEHIIKLLDNEAQKIGVTRQSIIKVWIAERLKEEQKQQLAFPRQQLYSYRVFSI